MQTPSTCQPGQPGTNDQSVCKLISRFNRHSAASLHTLREQSTAAARHQSENSTNRPASHHAAHRDSFAGIPLDRKQKRASFHVWRKMCSVVTCRRVRWIR
jgi:hypothetical protein